MKRWFRNARDEVKDQKTFESLCFDKSISCVLTLLEPENTGEESHEKYLTVLDNINKKNGDKFTFLWVDGNKQYDFADKLNVATGNNLLSCLYIIHQCSFTFITGLES